MQTSSLESDGRRTSTQGSEMRDALEHGRRAVRIRPARTQEGERLREIAIASKSYWGYDLERVKQWAAMGDYSPKWLRDTEVYVAEADGQAVAWTALIPKGELLWLDDLWVEPAWIGQGVGSRLFRHAVARAKELGGTRLEWEAEPNAVGFYERMGARYLRDGVPSEWGRVLAVMGIDLAVPPAG
jgi:GNAT superfamily N-acetyltransferase